MLLITQSLRVPSHELSVFGNWRDHVNSANGSRHVVLQYAFVANLWGYAAAPQMAVWPARSLNTLSDFLPSCLATAGNRIPAVLLTLCSRYLLTELRGFESYRVIRPLLRCFRTPLQAHSGRQARGRLVSGLRPGTPLMLSKGKTAIEALSVRSRAPLVRGTDGRRRRREQPRRPA